MVLRAGLNHRPIWIFGMDVLYILAGLSSCSLIPKFDDGEDPRRAGGGEPACGNFGAGRAVAPRHL